MALPAGSSGSSGSSGSPGSSGSSHAPRIVIVMGVSGSGKTTIGRALAAGLGCDFQEGDDLHPQANRAKLRAGIPLDDDDRAPWLAAVAAWIDRQRQAGRDAVISCSALKRAYRAQLRRDRPEVRMIYLRAAEATIAERIRARTHAFMPASLLHSQFETLEAPQNEVGVDVIDVDNLTPEQTVQQALVRLKPLANSGN